MILIRIVICCVLLLPFQAIAISYDENTRDSLLSVSKEAGQSDTIRFRAFVKLSKHYSKVNLDSSIFYANRALSFAKELGAKLFEAEALFRLGTALNVQGKYVEAIEYYQKMGLVYDELGSKSGQALFYNVMGALHRRIKEYERALVYYNKSMELQLELNNESKIIGLYNNLGNLYWDMKDYRTALSCHEKCLNYKIKMNEKDGIANSSNGVGGLHEEMGDYKLAEEYYIKSKGLYEELQDVRGLSFSFLNLGSLYNKKGSYRQSVTYCEKGLKYAREVGDVELVVGNCGCLSFAHEKLGNGMKALDYYKRQISTLDSSNNDAISREIARKELQFEYEKKAAADSAHNAQLQKVKDAELLIQQTQLEKEETYRTGLVGLLFIFLLFAAFVYNRLQLSKRQNRIIQEQKGIVEVQKTIVDEQNKDIIDSIRYAENIQNAILPVETQLKKLLPNSFVIFKPKDIVSGDFYWVSEQNGSVYFAVCDCTGHGVPGAFMSVIGSSLLNEAVNEKGIEKPNHIFQEVRKGFIDALKQTGEYGEQKDGMDAVLCHWDRANKLEFAAAFSPLILIRNRQIQEVKADKHPVGIFLKEEKPYTHHEIEVEKGDMLYLFSDGYSDQFGGPRGKKFKYSLFKKLLLNIHDKSMDRQKLILEDTMAQWQGDENQVDDILVMGVRF